MADYAKMIRGWKPAAITGLVLACLTALAAVGVIPDLPGYVKKGAYDAAVAARDARIAQLEKIVADVTKPAPYTLNWPDRRPIGMFMRGGSTAATFVADAANATNNVVRFGGQGWIGWDFGTREYNGDPRLSDLPLDLFDQAFAYATSKGLRTGICLRADKRIGPNNYQPYASEAEAITGILDAARYAKQRWGCTIFYVDSNDWATGASLSPKVNEQMPDCLFIWENWPLCDDRVLPSDPTQYNSAAIVQGFLRTGSILVNFGSSTQWMWYGVPSWAPGFRVVRMDRWLAESDTYRAQFQGLLGAELKAGGIPMWECWYADHQMTEANRLKGL